MYKDKIVVNGEKMVNLYEEGANCKHMGESIQD